MTAYSVVPLQPDTNTNTNTTKPSPNQQHQYQKNYSNAKEIPTAILIDETDKPNPIKLSITILLFLLTITASCVLGLKVFGASIRSVIETAFDDEDDTTSETKENSKTFLSGGGRDWTIDTTHRAIVSKHSPELALGSFPHDPLILTHRYRDLDDGVLLNLPKPVLESLTNGECVSMDALSLGLQFPDRFDTYETQWDYKLTGVVRGNEETNRTTANNECHVRFVDENFLVLDGEYALDVSFWKMEEGNTVNFVKASETNHDEHLKTLQKGGGRDWVLNLDDGTISPKNDPHLALGRGSRSLVLIDLKSNPERVWRFHSQTLEELTDGGTVQFINESNESVLKMYEVEKHFMEWRYIESRVTSSLEDIDQAVRVTYINGNYLALSEEGRDEGNSLVLDVSFWKMEQYNTVNFVGGKLDD